jgi:glutamine synthetase
MINTVRTDVLRQVRERDIRLVRFLYCDTSAIIRAKSTHVRSLEDRLRTGIGLTKAMQAMCMLDQLASVDGLGAVGEIRLVPDPKTFTVLPYVSRAASMVVDMMTLDNKPWAFCPRDFLKRMLARLDAKGMKIRASFEGEFSLLVNDAGTLRPVDDSLCFSTVGMNASAPVISAIVEALDSQGLTVEQYYAELAHGQQELSIRHAEGLDAADNQITFRETVRGVALQHGLVASFAPKPFTDQAGNGCHMHFSLVGNDGRTPRFYDATAPYNLSPIARKWIAGVLDHLPALVAVTCASVNSYRRLQPQSWSSAYTCWGPDNREAAIRVASPFAGDEATTINAELKASDHTANPYLALGALVAAGLDGIERELELVDPVLVDPASLTALERDQRGIERLPATLEDAIAALEADSVLAGALGPELLSAFVGVKRLEARLFAAQDVDFELKIHNTHF